MKIVTWNCNGALRKKYHLLDGLNADLLIVQECEDPAQSPVEYQNWAGEYLWTGDNKNKGLAVFARNGYRIENLDWKADRLQLFLPVRLNDKSTLLAVWTKQAGSKHFGYIGQLWKYLQLHKDKLVQDGTIICGDFNSNAIWHDHECWWNHLDVVREIEKIGIHSLYHSVFDEQQGKETRPTLYMHRSLERPYHIDYVFAHESVLDSKVTVEVGDSSIWLAHSDHMPVFADIELTKH